MSLNTIVTFRIIDESSTSDKIYEFLTSSMNWIKKSYPELIHSPFVLDNSKKHRTLRMIEFLKKGYLRTIFTTPLTPKQNFAEIFFKEIKTGLWKKN